MNTAEKQIYWKEINRDKNNELKELERAYDTAMKEITRLRNRVDAIKRLKLYQVVDKKKRTAMVVLVEDLNKLLK